MKNENRVIRDFGHEWEKFNFLDVDSVEALKEQFNKYLAPLPLSVLSNSCLVGADFGAGTGRWSHFLRDYCKILYVLEPSAKAFQVASNRLITDPKIILLKQSIERNDIPPATLDFAFCVGVLHHLQNTQQAIISIQTKVKPGGYFVGYLYYALENKSKFYRLLWRTSDLIRKIIAKLPKVPKFIIADVIALAVYFPLAKLSTTLSKLGIPTQSLPLHQYANLTFTVMRNDSLDRFGTTLENRFSKKQIEELLFLGGFDISTLEFSNDEPFWTFCIRKNSNE